MIIDLRDDPDAFRSAVREWIADTLPSDWAEKAGEGGEEALVEMDKWWMRQRHTEGLAIGHWPTEYGGADLSLRGQIILADEMARASAPGLGTFTVSLNHIPGTLIPFGTEEQKKRHLPKVPEGTVWCQGFSEPSAGSDLASLRTRAVRDGDDYVVNGQKIWSSMSRFAQHCLLLVRTDPDVRKHAGITYLLMDMDTPGLEVRKIRQINGEAEFSELFLTDVRIPVANRIGEENQGWAVAQATLASERGVLWFNTSERRHTVFEKYYQEALESGAAWLEDDELRRDFMVLFTELQAGRRQIRKLLRENDHGNQAPMLSSLLVKMVDTTMNQKIGELFTRIDGLDGQREDICPEFTRFVGMYEYLTSYGATISGGTNEIIRNMISERALGMPKG